MRVNLTKLREDAHEDAEIRVSALLQAFAMPGISQDAIRKLLVDTIANTHVAGYAQGWDAAIDTAADLVGKVERFRPPR